MPKDTERENAAWHGKFDSLFISVRDGKVLMYNSKINRKDFLHFFRKVKLYTYFYGNKRILIK